MLAAASGNVTNGVRLRSVNPVGKDEGVNVMDVQVLLASLIKNSSWLKFLGVMLIVQGVLVCLSIIGILVGWIPIWLGVLLFVSGTKLDRVRLEDSEADAIESIEKISLYFKINAVLTLLVIVLAVLGFVLAGLGGLAAFSYVTGW